MSEQNNDLLLFRNINKFKYTRQSIFKIMNYIENKIGEKPKCLKYYPEKWNIKNNKLYFDDKLIIPRSEAIKYILKIYYDRDEPFGRDTIFNILKEDYIGITKSLIQKVLTKLHKNGIWLIDEE